MIRETTGGWADGILPKDGDAAHVDDLIGWISRKQYQNIV